eukprot:CCRYP_018081-RA/>CCRYP_018081-RA protein AED:0.34 eAED:0.34 QI:0/0/0/1/0/0/2/0/123
MVMNPYDMCVANKETKNGQQLTVLWHVDDLKISCKDKFEVAKLICYLNMSSYVEGIIEEFPETLSKCSPTPHSDGLFAVKDNENSQLLDEDKAMQFHRTTAQLLFLSTQARKDIQTAVSFLTT